MFAKRATFVLLQSVTFLGMFTPMQHRGHMVPYNIIIATTDVWATYFEPLWRDAVWWILFNILFTTAILLFNKTSIIFSYWLPNPHSKHNSLFNNPWLVPNYPLSKHISLISHHLFSFTTSLIPSFPQLQEQLSGSNAKLLEDCRGLLGERMSELMQLAEDCLMILYLEIRVQCYYHLLILLRKVQTFSLLDIIYSIIDILYFITKLDHLALGISD